MLLGSVSFTDIPSPTPRLVAIRLLITVMTTTVVMVLMMTLVVLVVKMVLVGRQDPC